MSVVLLATITSASATTLKPTGDEPDDEVCPKGTVPAKPPVPGDSTHYFEPSFVAFSTVDVDEETMQPYTFSLLRPVLPTLSGIVILSNHSPFGPLLVPGVMDGCYPTADRCWPKYRLQRSRCP